jgi:hypothetical protein
MTTADNWPKCGALLSTAMVIGVVWHQQDGTMDGESLRDDRAAPAGSRDGRR